ncbi:MAG: alanine--tRNA ligase [Symbiobacteriaceae bacterium]|nr:alanine--tRNA ligase [Symbiobacteriaceae bacterium]
MRQMTSAELRECYQSFFEQKNHLRLAGASMIPVGDPSLLLIGAGMAPFKAYFTGIATPPSPRVVTCQRCIRTADLEQVGRTARHGSFFEMLGNFSFGDYFKREAIQWAWEFLREHLQLPEEKLYITVHEKDDEAYNIWHDEIGIAPAHLYRLGDKDNFWEIGVGPCGPDSEIFYDRGAEHGCANPNCAPGCDCDRFLEIWNLVFTQYDKDEVGNLTPLTRRCIDTGMGLDRVSMVLQGTRNIFEIDACAPLLAHLCELTNTIYDGTSPESVALSVIIDHLKGVIMLIADGVLPGNEERSYVLRRLVRRAVRYGRMRGIRHIFLAEAAQKLFLTYSEAYPELKAREEFILRVIETEERRFQETLDSGLHLVTQSITEMQRNNQEILDGEVAFRLHDTFGFPLELTQELLAEKGLRLNQEGFRVAMERQRNLARESRSMVDAMGVGRAGLSRFLSNFQGYEELELNAKVLAIWSQGEQVAQAAPGSEVEVVTDVTPFYPEGGGEVSDSGVALLGNSTIPVTAVYREAGTLVHRLALGDASLAVGDTLQFSVDRERRLAISRHHSATHLLHYALRQVLGSHATQSGSLVNEHRLRFDYSHFNAPTLQELQEIENIVNSMILRATPVFITNVSLEEAKVLGAMALFEEKYEETVRVVRIADAVELCGGCHVRQSGEIGLFKIISESSIGSGMRRIEAVAGLKLLQLLAAKEEILTSAVTALKTIPEELVEKIIELQQRLRELEREEEKNQTIAAVQLAKDLVQQAKELNGVNTVVAQVGAMSMEHLRLLADLIRDRLGSGVVLLAARQEDKYNLLTAVTKDLAGAKAHAGNLMREVARLLGGSGGGRSDLAQGGAPGDTPSPSTWQQLEELLVKHLKKES